MKSRWPLQRLGEIADLSSPRVAVDPEAEYPFVSMAAIDQETGLHCTYRMVPGRELKSKNRFLPGDILFARITPCVQNGKIALAPEIETPVGFATTEVFRIGPRPGIDRKYLLYFLRSPRVRTAAEANMTGTTNRRRVPREFLEQLQVPVPSLDEQRRIAARLDAAFAVLQQITQTESKIVARVDGIESLCVERFLKRRDSWPMTTVGAVADVLYGVTKNPSRSGGHSPTPYLRVANVQQGYLDLREIKYMDLTPDEVERWRLIPGDILVCEGNSADLVGRAAEFRGEIENCVHQNHIIRVRPNPRWVVGSFLLNYMNSGVGRAYFRSKAKKTTNLATINSSEVRSMPIALPPLRDQRWLVRRLESIRGSVLAIRTEQEARGRAIRAVATILLDRVFQGASDGTQ